MSSKSKRPRKRSHKLQRADTKATTKLLQSDLDEVMKVYRDRPQGTSCPACIGAIQALEHHGEILLRAMELLSKYDEKPEEAAKFLIDSHTLYAEFVRKLAYITLETANNSHTRMDPCPHMEDDGGCSRGTCCSASSVDQTPEEPQQAIN